MQNNDDKFIHFFLRTKVKPQSGETISEVMKRSSIPFFGPCGGKGKCGKCKVKIEGIVPSCTNVEKQLLTEEDICSGVRLACRTEAKAGMKVSVSDDSQQNMKHEMQIFEDAAITTESTLTSRDNAVKSTYSIAVDIGTTTVVAYLVNNESGKTAAISSSMNPQAPFGSDVISRICYINDHEDGLYLLHNKIVDAINRLIYNLLRKTQVKEGDVSLVVISANATMEHIFAGISPASMGRAPFTPPYYAIPPMTAKDIGLALFADTRILFLPNISGFVGGDITSGILYTAMINSDELSLLIDIGTNNEMVLACKGFLLCCSAAAGPALEGAKISQGMCALEGAIDHVKIVDGNLCLSTIDGASAVGICGSGLVDAMSALLSEGVINKDGKFNQKMPAEHKLFPKLEVIQKRFMLAENRKGKVYITQKDIREVQLAKSAIATGVEIMLEEVGRDIADIDKIYLAGAFGNYMNVENAIRVGILPNVSQDKIKPIGNSSGYGAVKLISHPELWNETKKIIDMAKHIELATHEHFQHKFINKLSFL